MMNAKQKPMHYPSPMANSAGRMILLTILVSFGIIAQSGSTAYAIDISHGSSVNAAVLSSNANANGRGSLRRLKSSTVVRDLQEDGTDALLDPEQEEPLNPEEGASDETIIEDYKEEEESVVDAVNAEAEATVELLQEEEAAVVAQAAAEVEAVSESYEAAEGEGDFDVDYNDEGEPIGDDPTSEFEPIPVPIGDPMSELTETLPTDENGEPIVDLLAAKLGAVEETLPTGMVNMTEGEDATAVEVQYPDGYGSPEGFPVANETSEENISNETAYPEGEGEYNDPAEDNVEDPLGETEPVTEAPEGEEFNATSGDQGDEGYGDENPDDTENVDPYGEDENVDPYGEDQNVDPYGQDENVDPYGEDQNVDPYGEDENVDPYGEDENVDPYGEDENFDPEDESPEDGMYGEGANEEGESLIIEETSTSSTSKIPSYGDESPAPSPNPTYDEDEDEDYVSEWWEKEAEPGKPTRDPTPKPTVVYVPREDPDPVAEEVKPDTQDFEEEDEVFYHGLGGKVGSYLDGVESPQEMEKDANVQVIGGILAGLFMGLVLITAHLVMNYPDGLCAGCCRLTLKVICCFTRTLCLPCRAICCKGSDQASGRRTHAPMRTPFPTDLELA